MGVNPVGQARTHVYAPGVNAPGYKFPSQDGQMRFPVLSPLTTLNCFLNQPARIQ